MASLVNADILVTSPLADADWVKEQESLIKNYRDFENIKSSSFIKPDNGLIKGKYESQTEFDTRVKINYQEKLKTYHVISDAEFDVPDDTPVVNFIYETFQPLEISKDHKVEKNNRIISRDVLNINKFDLGWRNNSSRIKLSYHKSYLQKNDADVVIVRVVRFDEADMSNYSNTISVQDTTLKNQEQISLVVNYKNANIIAAGLYDQKNNVVLGIFSRGHEYFYNLTTNTSFQLKSGVLLDSDLSAKNNSLRPIYVKQAKYPRIAQIKGTEGYAIVEFAIDGFGGVRYPILVEEYPVGWGFGRSALKAAKEVRYKPRIIGGSVQEFKGARYKFTFNMAK